MVVPSEYKALVERLQDFDIGQTSSYNYKFCEQSLISAVWTQNTRVYYNLSNPDSYSYALCSSGSIAPLTNGNFDNVGSKSFIVLRHATLDIITNLNGGYDVSYSALKPVNDITYYSNRYYVYRDIYYNGSVRCSTDAASSYTFNKNSYTSHFEDLTTAITYLGNNFRNFDLYVNGDFWDPTEEPTYNWQSVPSISGKNGILQSLVQIKEEALNDGEPVSEATVLSFDSLGNINIPSVIDEQMPVDPSDVTSVTATYLIPMLEYGSYSYIKLAIKKNNIPLSLEDADRVIDLDEPATITRIGSATVSGLDELSHYYFVIFIEDELGNTATSEPMDCVTGESIVPPEIQAYIDIINKRTNDTPESFWFFDNLAEGGGLYTSGFRIYNCSWFTTGVFSTTEYTTDRICPKLTIQDINIYSSNSQYTCSFYWGNDNYTYKVGSHTYHFSVGSITDNGYLSSGYNNYYDINFNLTGSLEYIFSELAKRVKNVNIYVDGVCWGEVG